MRMWMNSKYVKKGDYFLVSKDNEKYVLDAIENGAIKIVTELDKKYEIETEKVESIRDYLYENYYDKINDLVLIGITGTNGKTTTCYLIYQMLNQIGINTAYLGTIGFYMNNNVIKLDNTTPGLDVLYNLLYDAKESGVKVVVMEVSSHALKQDRVYGLSFDAVGVTNITRDHLDYHKTVKDYVESKKKIIKMTRNKRICLLNSKSKYYRRFILRNNNNFIIGKNIKVNSVINFLDKTSMIIKDKIKYGYTLPLVGQFNVYNFLYAYYIVKKLGYNMDIINNNLFSLSEPPGRMQRINYNDNVIFIDYAHTPDAVKNVLKTVNKIKNKGIITIIGCGGNRDKTKRPIMAKFSCKYSDLVIFTNDNPRSEDEKKIIEDILVGATGNYEVIYDREKAIRRGIELLKENMILMILGKGHENYQIIGDEKVHFSDYEVVKKIIDK